MLSMVALTLKNDFVHKNMVGLSWVVAYWVLWINTILSRLKPMSSMCINEHLSGTKSEIILCSHMLYQILACLAIVAARSTAQRRLEGSN